MPWRNVFSPLRTSTSSAAAIPEVIASMVELIVNKARLKAKV